MRNNIMILLIPLIIAPLSVFCQPTKTTQQQAIYYYNQADSLNKQEKPSDAVIWYTMAIEKADITTDVYFISYLFRAFCKLELNDNRGAWSDAEKAISLNVSNAVVVWDIDLPEIVRYYKALCYFIRGKAKYNLGFKEEGCWDFSKSGELGNTDIYSTISSLCK